MKRLVVLNKSGHGLFLLCKTKHFFMMLFLLCLSGVSAQTLQVMTDARGKLGYKDADGNIVIKCVYDYAEPFDANGVAKVGKAGKYGLLSTDGSFVLPMVYAEIQTRVEGVPTVVKKGKKYGLINPVTGAIMLPVEYSFVSAYNCYGLAWFTKGGKIEDDKGKQSVSDGKMGIVDKAGNILLQPEHGCVFEFTKHIDGNTPNMYGEADLLAPFNYQLTDTLVTDCQFLGFGVAPKSVDYAGVITLTGTVVLEKDKYMRVSKPVDMVMRYWNIQDDGVNYGYYDIAAIKEYPQDTMKIEIKGDKLKEIEAMEKAEKEINESSSMLPSLSLIGGLMGNNSFFGTKKNKAKKQSSTTVISNALANVRTMREEAMKEVIDSIRTATHYDFNGGMALVGGPNGWSVIDRAFAVKEADLQKLWFTKGAETDRGYWAGISSKGVVAYKDDGTKLLQNMSFSDVSLPDFTYGNSTNIAVKHTGKWGLYTEKGVVLINPKYEYLTSSRHGMYLCKTNGPGGAVNEKGLVLIPIRYKGIIPPQDPTLDNVWVMGSDSLYYNYELKTKKTLPQKYKKAEAFRDGMAMVLPVNVETKSAGERILVGRKNEVLVGKPFPVSCETGVREAVVKNGGRALTAGETHRLVLGMIQNTAHYRMNTVIEEEAWDY